MRLVKHIPNTITSMNLLFGIFGLSIVAYAIMQDIINKAVS